VVTWLGRASPPAGASRCRPGMSMPPLARGHAMREVTLSTSAIPLSCSFFQPGTGFVYFVCRTWRGIRFSRDRLAPGRNCRSKTHAHRQRPPDALASPMQEGDHPPRHQARREHLRSGCDADVADFGIARAISAAGSLTLTQAGQRRSARRLHEPGTGDGLGDSTHGPISTASAACCRDAGGGAAGASMTERRVHNWRRSRPAGPCRGPRGGRAGRQARDSRALAPLPDDRFPAVTEFAPRSERRPISPSVPTRRHFDGRRDAISRSARGCGRRCSASRHPAHVLRRSGSQLNQPIASPSWP